MLIRFRFILPVFLYLLPSVTYAQVRNLNAIKTTQSIKIDGNLDDAAWKNVEPTGDFITLSPVFGKPSTHKMISQKISVNNLPQEMLLTGRTWIFLWLGLIPITIDKMLLFLG
jgi:hypothetical protein